MLEKFIQDCHDNLTQKRPHEALGYLKSRSVNEESIKTHQIGYCYSDQKLPPEVQYFGRATLQPTNNHDSGYAYFIQGRLILPIYAEFGELVGFATRVPSHEEGNSWWNAPAPFKKGNHLFLLNKSRQQIFNENKVYIVEGYMDAIIAFQSGLKNVVALMGTALTSRKIGLITRYCDDISLALDVDKNEAGQKATEKSIYIINEFNIFNNISIVEMPIKEDPASFILKNNLEKFLEMERLITDKDISIICNNIRKQSKKK